MNRGVQRDIDYEPEVNFLNLTCQTQNLEKVLTSDSWSCPKKASHF